VAKHSPLPWVCRGNEVFDRDDNLIARVYSAHNDGDDEEEAEANAVLVVTGVNLLALCDRLEQAARDALHYLYAEGDLQARAARAAWVLDQAVISKPKGIP
jgi:hypothetical protein